MSTFYPSIYDNTYKYNTLQSNSIVITTQTGFADVAAASNTVLICNENGQWVTSSLDNYATSTDITNIQNSINTLSTYDDILQQSISNNLIAINTLQTNLTNNYFTKIEITDNLSNYVDITTYDELNNALGEEFTYISNNIQILSNDITTISNNVQILTDDIIIIQDTFHGLDQIADDYSIGHEFTLEGAWKLYGTVTLYISDITKMTPAINNLTEEEWLSALPEFEITFTDSDDHTHYIFNTKLESNRPLITIPVNGITTLPNSTYYIKTNLFISTDINVTHDDIYLYEYRLYLERISGYKYINNYPPE